jgi:nonsense-mediated mRNA decay protein 3
MSFKKFCAKCGRDDDSLIHGLCSECFLKRKELFELKEIMVERCVKCNKLRIKGHWTDYSEEAIAKEVSSKVKFVQDLDQPKVFVELSHLTKDDFEAKIIVEGFLESVLIKQEKIIPFYLHKVSCDSCMKMVSNYREAIIQLRASSSSEVEAMLEVTKQFFLEEQSKDSLAKIVKTTRSSNGIDLWIGSNAGAAKVVRKLSKLYKLAPVFSRKQTGGGFGKKQEYRFTYLVKKD